MTSSAQIQKYEKLNLFNYGIMLESNDNNLLGLRRRKTDPICNLSRNWDAIANKQRVGKWFQFQRLKRRRAESYVTLDWN